jgi:hypothetical protein
MYCWTISEGTAACFHYHELYRNEEISKMSRLKKIPAKPTVSSSDGENAAMMRVLVGVLLKLKPDLTC